MKKTVLFALIIALMLSACGAPAAGPTPAPDAGPNVDVHWDVLTPKPENVAERWYEDYTPDLIPSDEYGQLVPYIGGEAQSEIWGNSWFYGLATRDGVIVTDPVFLEINTLDWYDPAKYGRVQGGALTLRTAIRSETEPADEYALGFEDRYGLAAIDGSWYTGQVYTDLVCQSELGALFFDLDGDLVMVSDVGGAELWRWEAGEIPLEGLVPDMYYWDCVSSSGHYMIYTEWDGATGITSVTRGSGAAKSGSAYYNSDDLFWLSRVIYTESGNQPLEGKMAVGNVVLNRVKHPSFANTIEGVLAQKNQFTTYWSGHIGRSTPNAESVIAAKLVLDGGVVEEVKNALYFDSTGNSWASRNRTCVAVIGGHRFYA